MANPSKPWKAEYAKSARSSCKTCKSPIGKEVFRLGKMVQATQFDGFMPMWNHASCILKKPKQIKSIDDVEGIELLRWEDQQKVRNYLESGGGPSNTNDATPMEHAIEVSQTSRATCKGCNDKIKKGEVRISSKPEGQGARGLVWHHAGCFIKLSPSTELEKLTGWRSLSASDQKTVNELVKKDSSVAKSGKRVEVLEDKEIQQAIPRAVTKRKNDSSSNRKPKVAKVEGDVLTSSPGSTKNAKNMVNTHPKNSDLENKLEAQTKELWALKDDLKEHVITAELREMLEVNGQDATGSELDLRDRW